MGYSALQLQADVASGSSSGQAMKDVEQLVNQQKMLAWRGQVYLLKSEIETNRCLVIFNLGRLYFLMFSRTL